MGGRWLKREGILKAKFFSNILKFILPFFAVSIKVRSKTVTNFPASTISSLCMLLHHYSINKIKY